MGRAKLTLVQILAAGCLLMVGVATGRSMGVEPLRSSATGVQQLNSVDSMQPSWQIIGKERDLCSKDTDNCATSKCCKTSGHRCYATNLTHGACKKYCEPSATVSCTPLSVQLTLEADAGRAARSLYCFAVYTANTGSPKPSHEKELLALQHAQKTSIFACNAFSVYSDVEVEIASGVTTKKVTDVNGDWHFAKRKETGAWVNTGMFVQVWKAIAAEKTYQSFDWVVKADPDAVFVPTRLVARIQYLPRTVAGVFLQNCRSVDYGFFGNLEVFSHQAFNILLANVDTCLSTLPWKVGIKEGKYGPMGEDLFAEICMSKNGVDKIEAFDITTDGACEGDRPYDQAKNKKWHADCSSTRTPAMHPFKKPADYKKCLDATMLLG